MQAPTASTITRAITAVLRLIPGFGRDTSFSFGRSMFLAFGSADFSCAAALLSSAAFRRSALAFSAASFLASLCFFFSPPANSLAFLRESPKEPRLRIISIAFCISLSAPLSYRETASSYVFRFSRSFSSFCCAACLSAAFFTAVSSSADSGAPKPNFTFPAGAECFFAAVVFEEYAASSTSEEEPVSPASFLPPAAPPVSCALILITGIPLSVPHFSASLPEGA